MSNDPIIDEIRQIRDERARHFNYDIRAMYADLMERQKSRAVVTDVKAWVAEREAARRGEQLPIETAAQ